MCMISYLYKLKLNLQRKNFEMLPAAAGYDRAITVFSPDGRLYQVEYAIETVRRGTLALGIKYKEGIILAVEEKPRKLQNSEITQKIFQVDDHIGVAAAGYIPDARSQVDNARFFSQSNRMIYDEPIEVESVAKHLADQCQQFTQYAGVRPFGVALIIAGIDKSGSTIFLTDPSGTYISYDAVAIGAGSDQVTEYLEKYYKKDMSFEDAATLAIESIYLVSEEKEGIKHIKMAQIPIDTKVLARMQEKDIEKFSAKAKENAEKRQK
jgi:proteasome alpha subunit